MARDTSGAAETPLTRLALATLVGIPGLFIVAVGTGLMEVDPSTVHAPYWLVTLLGGMFVFVGLWLGSRGTRFEAPLQMVAGPAVAVGLLTALHWVAFGPGVRNCSGSFTLPFGENTRAIGNLECRLAFGYGAFLFDGVVAAVAISQFARKYLAGTAARFAETVSNVLLIVALAPLLVVLIVSVAAKAGVGWLKRGRSTATPARPREARR